MKAILMLEDGTSFVGKSFGAEGEVTGEVVFNTQVVGFQELLTDPANQGKLIAFGYPHVGNAGINQKSYESEKAQAGAFIVKEYSELYSNWQATGSFAELMKKDKVLGLTGIDTRSLTLHLRDKGELRGIVSTKDFNKQNLIAKAQKHTRPVYRSTAKTAGKSKVTIIDLGVNRSTLATYEGARVVGEEATAEKILSGGTEQIVISSGPGDPTALPKLVEEIKQLIGKVPIYGIQNGACLLAQALGGKVYRMKVGHHGANQPVVDPKSGRGEISWQNHSYGVEALPDKVKVVHVNLNDKTIEKFQSPDGSCVGTLYFPIDQRGKLDPGYKYV